MWMSLDYGRKLEHLESTHTGAGGTWKRHTERPHVGLKPTTLLLWGNSANNCAAHAYKYTNFYKNQYLADRRFMYVLYLYMGIFCFNQQLFFSWLVRGQTYFTVWDLFVVFSNLAVHSPLAIFPPPQNERGEKNNLCALSLSSNIFYFSPEKKRPHRVPVTFKYPSEASIKIKSDESLWVIATAGPPTLFSDWVIWGQRCTVSLHNNMCF